jgi:chromosome segregation ATPase
MSTETEKNDSNNSNEENNTIDYSKLDKNELIKKNPFVIDLLVKFDVLKKGIVEERKKTSILVSKIKQLEEELNSKTNELKKLAQEKLNNEDIKNKSEMKDKQSEMALISAKEEIRKLNEQLINLKLEEENTNNKMKKTIDETEDLKKEYQMQIKLLSQKNDSLLKEIKSLKSEKSDLEKEKEKLQTEIKTKALTPPPEMIKEREILIKDKERLLGEKEHFEALLKDIKKGKEEALQQLEENQKIKTQLQIDNNKLKEENNKLNESKTSLETNAGKMALKLTEYKNMVLDMNLRNQVFHVKKAGLISHNEIDIIFYKTKEGDYIMRIDEKNNSDNINILDVEFVKQSQKNKNKVDISYMYKSKKYNLSVIVNELVVQQFVDAYKNFYSESMKSQNKLGL